MQLLIKDKRAIFDVEAGAPGVLGLVSRLEGSKIWLKDGGGLSLVPSQYNIGIVTTLFPDTQIINEAIVPAEEFADEFTGGMLRGYVPKTRPRKHQMQASQAM